MASPAAGKYNEHAPTNKAAKKNSANSGGRIAPAGKNSRNRTRGGVC